MQGNNNNNSGLLWGTIITIWGLHGHNNIIGGCTNNSNGLH